MKNNEDKKNIFWARDVYKNYDTLLSIKCPTIEELSKDCVFVLDTNILLFPFDLGKQNLDKILEYYKILIKAKKLFIPAQVFREFVKNRGTKISELYNSVADKRNINMKEFNNYPLLKNSTYFSEAKKIEKEISKLYDKYRKNIGLLLQEIKNWSISDPVSMAYQEIFDNSIIVDITYDDKTLIEDWENRKLNSIPPGYKDKSIGDLIIWETILKIGSEQKSNLIFISGDEKPDWMIRSNNEKISPRFELLYEYYEKTNGFYFNILSLSKFLELQDLDKDTIESVRTQEILNRQLHRYPVLNTLSKTTKEYLINYLKLRQIDNDDISFKDIKNCINTLPIEAIVGPILDTELNEEYSDDDIFYHTPLRPAEDDGSSWWAACTLTPKGKIIFNELNTLAEKLSSV